MTQLAGIIKDSLKEFREELAQVDEGEEGEEEEEEEEKACPATSSGPPPLMSSCMSVLECSLQLVHASQEVLTSLLRGRAVPAEAAAAGGSGSLSPLTLALDGICVACQAVEDAVIDFADAMNDLEVIPATLTASCASLTFRGVIRAVTRDPPLLPSGVDGFQRKVFRGCFGCRDHTG